MLYFILFSQTEEMNYAMDGLNKYSTEDDINALALKHFDDQTLIQVNQINKCIKCFFIFYLFKNYVCSDSLKNINLNY